MPHQNIQFAPDVAPSPGWQGVEQRIASYQRELTEQRGTEIRLREALVHSEALLHEKEEVLHQQELLNRECRHRWLNNLHMIVALLSLQGRREASPETAFRLATAASRVRAISGLHQHLHSLDDLRTVEFKRYLDELCRGLLTLSISEECIERPILVEAIELNLPTTIGIPLSLIVNELVTNAIKRGRGRIIVTLAQHAGGSYALSVGNAGCDLPEDFDPAAGKGPGMTLVASFIAQIGGDLRVDRDADNDCTRFTVLFTSRP